MILLSAGGAMSTVLELLRANLIRLAPTATLEEIGKIPERLLGISVSKSSPREGGRSRRSRIPKKMRRSMTRQEADAVRLAMKGLEKGSTAFRKKQDEICRQHGYTRRQVGCSVSGLEKAAERKKAKKKV